MTTKTYKERNVQNAQCKAYTQAKGAYSSFMSGEQCKRRAKKDGYCIAHYKLINPKV